MTAKFTAAADLLQMWPEEILHGKPAPLFPVGQGELARIEVGPGRVVLLGGAPGAGKTAFVMQLVLDGLRMTPELRALVCNIEMTPAALLERQLARLSGVDLTTIHKRAVPPEQAEAVGRGVATLQTVADRLTFVEVPYTLRNVAECYDAGRAGLIVLDYVQRIAVGDDKPRGDKRAEVDATMDYIRRFANGGAAVIVVSALSRGKSKGGQSTYTGAGLASFKESSELEFGADDAFILEAGEMGSATLKHLKARHSEQKDITLVFDGAHQSFRPFSELGNNTDKRAA